jgi:lysophospholipase L1-like esterase
MGSEFQIIHYLHEEAPDMKIHQTTLVTGKRERSKGFIVCVAGLVAALMIQVSFDPASRAARGARRGPYWIGTWATAAQPSGPSAQPYANQTLRLIVHTSIGGPRVRIKISNTYGNRPLVIGAAHIALRTAGADIEPASDRALMFGEHASTTVAAGSMVASDPVDLLVPELSDLAISIFLPEATPATTVHSLAKQTNYIAAETGDHTADLKFPVARTIRNWPFLTGVEVATSSRAAAIVAFGSSLTDGDGTTADTNRRWPDVLAERLQKSGKKGFGVLNEGIIGNRLLHDSPVEAADGRFGRVLGESGLARFERDVLAQPGTRFVVLGLGINDLAFPGSLTPETEKITAEMIVAGYRELIRRAHRRGIKIIGTTNAPFENCLLDLPSPAKPITFYTPEKEIVRQKVNEWILNSGEFDAVVDLDRVLRDPNRPTQINPAYDSGDHLHPNNAGSIAEADAFPLTLFAPAKSSSRNVNSQPKSLF